MTNQPITGYRTLTEGEVAKINEIKDVAHQVGALVDAVKAVPGVDGRWAAIAQTDLQKGFMALARAIAQPTTF